MESQLRRIWLRRTSVLAAVILVAAACQAQNGATDSTQPGPDTTTSAADGPTTSQAAGSTTTPSEEYSTEERLVYLCAICASDVLDPAHPVNENTNGQEVLRAVFDRLIHFTDDIQLTSGLATDWHFEEETTVFVMNLREGVVFHDGTPFNADAVKANLDRIVALGDEAGLTVAAAAAAIDEVEVRGPSEVAIHLTEANGTFPFFLAQQPGMMVSPQAIAASPGVGVEPIGTGPYEVKEFRSQELAILSRFDQYWDTSRPWMKEIEVQFVGDAQARLNALRSGQAHLAKFDISEIPEAAAQELEVVVVGTVDGAWLLHLNHSRESLSDLRVREAISYGIDRDAIAGLLGRDGTGLPTHQMFAKGYYVHLDEYDEIRPYDPDHARELLEEAGYGEGLELEIQLLDSEAYAQMGQALQAMMADIGITLNLKVVDVSRFAEFNEGQSDMAAARWGGRPDPLLSLQLSVGPDATYMPGGVVTERLAELLDEASGLPADDPGRAEIVREANAEVIEQLANIPIISRSNVYAAPTGCIANLGGPGHLSAGSDPIHLVLIRSTCEAGS
jgi:peptide/nickel transport system substrate-binding protein